MPRDVRVLEPQRPLLEAALGVVLGQLLASRVELARVADVGEGQGGSGAGQQPAQRQRVVVVGRPVVRYDQI
jgi:hypothetical protein